MQVPRDPLALDQKLQKPQKTLLLNAMETLRDRYDNDVYLKTHMQLAQKLKLKAAIINQFVSTSKAKILGIPNHQQNQIKHEKDVSIVIYLI